MNMAHFHKCEGALHTAHTYVCTSVRVCAYVRIWVSFVHVKSLPLSLPLIVMMKPPDMRPPTTPQQQISKTRQRACLDWSLRDKHSKPPS